MRRQGEDCFWSPLHCAASAGSKAIVKLLVNSGASLDPPSRGLCTCRNTPLSQHPGTYGAVTWTPLHTALCYGNDSTAALLLSLGASPNLNPQRPKLSALHCAARAGSLRTMRFLLEGDHKTNINKQDEEGFTPLMWALGSLKSTGIINYLLRHGADLEIENSYGYTALQWACKNGWFEDAIRLVNARVNVPYGANQHFMPVFKLCFTALKSDPESRIARCFRPGRQFSQLQTTNNVTETASNADIVKFIEKMIRRGAVPSDSPKHAYFPFLIACATHTVSLVDLLLVNGSRVDQVRNVDGVDIFPLLAALDKRRVRWTADWPKIYETTECLLKHGAPPNQVTKDGRSALHEVCTHPQSSPNKLEILKLLVSYGADVNMRTFREQAGEVTELRSPFRESFYLKRIDICRYLWEQGVKMPNGKDDLRIMFEELINRCRGFHKTPYNQNHPAECCDALRLLLDIDSSKYLLRDPKFLLLTTRVAHIPLTEILLDAGASNGLHNTVHKGFESKTVIDRTRRLIAAGADVNCVDNQGESALVSLLRYFQCRSHYNGVDKKKVLDLAKLLLDSGTLVSRSDLRKLGLTGSNTDTDGLVPKLAQLLIDRAHDDH
ncbi:hypothetical protein AAE478_009164 [Parahypoxylon ruwenzoriense]